MRAMRSKAIKDLLIIAIIAIAVLVLSIVFEADELLRAFLQKNERWRADEILLMLGALAIGFAIFSWRRRMARASGSAQTRAPSLRMADCFITKARWKT
ncbi:MAG TPA: hypothetical protein VNN73_23750 [Blastocatellia bacterium]|nr:hypothetical protein [Blastocatellia bacterium]